MKSLKQTIRRIVPSELYMNLSRVKSNYCLNKEKNQFLKNGLKTIEKTCMILDDTKIKYFVALGTLLGLYRDGKLLKNDMDIDIFVYANNEDKKELIRKAFAQNKVKRVFTFDVKGIGCVQDSFIYRNVKIDATYIFEDNESDMYYLLYGDQCEQTLLFSYSKVNETIKKEMAGIKVTVPMDTEVFLRETYGEGWRKPDSDYKFWENPLAEKVYSPGIVERL